MHQYDPTAGTQVGGVEIFINSFAKYAPDDLEVRIVGITSDARAHPVGRWQRIAVGGRPIDFFPALAAQPGRTRAVPLSARLTWALMKARRQICLDNAVLTFHRIEPALSVRRGAAPEVLFLHAHSKDLYNPKTEASWRKAPALYHWLEARLISRMAQVFIVREDAAADYRARYPSLAQRIRFLPTWVDDEVFVSWPEGKRRLERELLAQRHGLSANRRWVLFIGRFEAQKDPLLLLEAFHRLNAGRRLRAQLVMIGRGTLEPRIKDYIGSGLGKDVRLVEPQPQAELVCWLNAADCLCLSSAFEGMPLVVLEALQCGLPVVSTATGQTARMLRAPAGVLVQDRSPEALARGLAACLSGAPDRAACRQAAAPYAARKALEQVYDRYRELHASAAPMQ